MTTWSTGDIARTSGGIPVVVLSTGRKWAMTVRLDNGRTIAHTIERLQPPGPMEATMCPRAQRRLRDHAAWRSRFAQSEGGG